MIRPPYCLPEDVLRLFDAQESLAQLDETDIDLIRDAIDDVGSTFEVETGHAFRLTRVGAPGTPETYEYADIEGSHTKPPLRVLLDHRYVLPFDPAEGDSIEYRSGRDEWTDITDQAGDEYILKYEEGAMKIFRWIIQRVLWNVPDDRYLRLSYRYGALGGRQGQGGQTELTEDVDDSSTTLSVANAGRLPTSGTVLIYGADDTPEYVDVTDVDYEADSLTVSRGERATDAASHSSGDTVHYCPESVRKAMAGKAAQEMQEYDMWSSNLVDTGEGISPPDRIDSWSSRYDRLMQKHSGVKKL